MLGETRRPWIDPAALKEKFLTLSARVHPDRVHGASDEEKRAANLRYTELNAAYQCLRDPKERLRHLLELERGARPADVQSIPSGLMDLYLDVSRLCREADGFLAGRAAVTSPLLRVGMFEGGQELTDKLQAFVRGLDVRRQSLAEEVKILNAGWADPAAADSPGRAVTLARLEELWRLFGYYGRWIGQIQERVVQLAVTA